MKQLYVIFNLPLDARSFLSTFVAASHGSCTICSGFKNAQKYIRSCCYIIQVAALTPKAERKPLQNSQSKSMVAMTSRKCRTARCTAQVSSWIMQHTRSRWLSSIANSMDEACSQQSPSEPATFFSARRPFRTFSSTQSHPMILPGGL